MKNFLIMATASLALMTSLAQGAPSFDLPETTTEIDLTGLLDKFNSDTGTLTGAVLTLEGSATSSITYLNSGSEQDVSATITIPFLFDEAALGVDLGDLALNVLIDYMATVGDDGATTIERQGSANLELTINDQGALAALSMSGGGAFEIGCRTMDTAVNTNVGDDIAVTAEETTAGCTGAIAYSSSSDPTNPPPPGVPSPAPLALLAVGWLGWQIGRRRKAR